MKSELRRAQDHSKTQDSKAVFEKEISQLETKIRDKQSYIDTLQSELGHWKTNATKLNETPDDKQEMICLL